MAIENEKKYLTTKSSALKLIESYNLKPEFIRQGILFHTDKLFARIRVVNNCGFLTIKDSAATQKRKEIEVSISYDDGCDLLKQCEYTLHKNRYTIPSEYNTIITLDEFLDDLYGIYVVEIENFPNQYEKPKFCYIDVTGVETFYTNYLCGSKCVRKNAVDSYSELPKAKALGFLGYAWA